MSSQGCDASLLLNTTANSTAEKDAGPNRTLEGFDVIEEAKAAVEAVCPGIVSCADVLALATRDSVSFQVPISVFLLPPETLIVGFQAAYLSLSPFYLLSIVLPVASVVDQINRSAWEVQTGRKDGLVSRASETAGNIPGPNANFTSLLRNFQSKNLTLKDLVVLSGAHTIGVGHCSIINRRLYNFTGRGDTDPALNAAYAALLKSQCPPGDTVATVGMDPGSSATFDNHYYQALKQGKGFFQSDAALLTDTRSSKIVGKLLGSSNFLTEFGQSMKKMGAIEALTGAAGEIRKICAVVNS